LIEDLDHQFGPENDDAYDFLLDQKTRYADLAPQRELEPF
jgi:hypothetical protein